MPWYQRSAHRKRTTKGTSVDGRRLCCFSWMLTIDWVKSNMNVFFYLCLEYQVGHLCIITYLHKFLSMFRDVLFQHSESKFLMPFATRCLKTPSPASKSCATSSKKKRNSSLPMTPSWHCIDLERYKVVLFMCRPLSYVLWKKASCLGWMIYRSVWTKHIQKSTCNLLMKSAICC